jgi:acetyl esterase/lipase
LASEEYYAYVERLRRRRPTDVPDVTERRTGWDKLTTFFPPPEDATFEPVDAGGVNAEWTYRTGDTSNGTILYFHGGGYCMGSVEGHRNLVARLAGASRARALSVDYGLAPESPFPAALEDARAACEWLLAEVGENHPIVVAGDSAGGGLALALLVALKNAGKSMPNAAVCMSPSTDFAANEDIDPINSIAGSAAFASLYLGATDERTPLASPLYADLTGLPPLLLLVGTWEILLDDSTRFADRAREAGVDVELQVWDEMMHIWPFFHGQFPEAQQAIDVMGAFIRGKLSG